jgi:hypothetical protein
MTMTKPTNMVNDNYRRQSKNDRYFDRIIRIIWQLRDSNSQSPIVKSVLRFTVVELALGIWVEDGPDEPKFKSARPQCKTQDETVPEYSE